MTIVHKALHRPPRLDKRDTRIIDHSAPLVPRVLFVAGSKGKGRMDDIAIDMVKLQSTATRFEGRLDPLWTMIGVPQLCCNEQVLSQKRPRREGFLNRLANRRFITIALRTIEVPKSCFQCGLGRLFGY